MAILDTVASFDDVDLCGTGILGTSAITSDGTTRLGSGGAMPDVSDNRDMTVWQLSTLAMMWQPPTPTQPVLEKRNAPQAANVCLAFISTLVPGSSDFRDGVLHYGSAAETAIMDYFDQRQVTSKSAGTALKALHTMHRNGDLDDRIASYYCLLNGARITDPSPMRTLRELKPQGIVTI
ncbi:hypothetical protein H257_13368 [Aphanomyces astaci]|uniref:Uncharacterized protein n=1 Tax=Aphanomyces astaci TaxID=112090 RepID=W4FXW5_APHAT|nr:hypothetical protein H257_13368 [Aphanomyces astaci]ETV71503.1 hypothetical protein H257_13368 [Aphanomyces astaci]|eukprot:XP_009839168.1 hypothetical protein H257_13368 [Aphanomyces astaci]